MELAEIKKIPTEIREENEEDKIIQLKDLEDLKLSKAFSTGFTGLDDKLMGGIRGGDLMILSGLSGRGKSTLSLQMMKNFSNNRKPVLLFSYEEQPTRMKWRVKEMGIDDNVLCFLPKKIKANTVQWIEQKILDGLANYAIEIIIIDNLDFLTAEKQLRDDDKWALQGRIIAMLKRIAIERDVAIILNAHIGKDKEENEPRMQDLYGSGDIYKLADFVLFIHRLREEPEGRARRADMPLSNRSKIILDKNRLTGLTGGFEVEFINNQFIETKNGLELPIKNEK